MDLLINGAKQLGIDLTEKQVDQFRQYRTLLLEWNQKINLTGITDPDEVLTKHFLDSMTPLHLIKQNATVIDVGSGAGFPGLVMKIARPDLQVTLLDSLNKRLIFLNDVMEKLELDGVQTVHSRAEDGGKNKAMREMFDVATARAVAALGTLCEYCLPYVRVDGLFLAMKGPLADEEIAGAHGAISILGGKLDRVIQTDIPGTDLRHNVVMIKKIRQTPAKYPRNAAKMAKSPLK